MRIITEDEIIKAVKKMCTDAAFDLSEDVKKGFRECLKTEESDIGKSVLNELLENAEIATKERLPLCQDTGFAVFFVDLGEDVHINGSLTKAINEGVRQAYKDAYLRKSILADPLRRKNTGDNTPAIIHVDFMEGDKIKIMFSLPPPLAENIIFILSPSIK